MATIAATLRLPQMSAEPAGASATAALLDRPALLILDNFESVIDQATQAGDLLTAAPQLRLLVTVVAAERGAGAERQPGGADAGGQLPPAGGGQDGDRGDGQADTGERGRRR